MEAELKEKLDSYGELELYLIIEAWGWFLWRMRHDITKGRIESTDAIHANLADIQANIEYAAGQTVRFGVPTPMAMQYSAFWNKDMLQATDEYWKWYRMWDSWCKALSDDEYRQMDNDLASGRDVSKWRPETFCGEDK